jgi:type IV secretion system protein VirB1
MLPGMEMMACTDLAVPREVMQHVVRIESSFNPYAIGVVGGRLARQPRNLSEAVSTARMLESKGYNFSLGIAQVNRYNLARYGLDSYERAFQVCPNLQAGSRILAECHGRAGGDWGKAFSCYYSGNFTTGFRHGYVQKVFASWQGTATGVAAIPLDLRGEVYAGRNGRLVSTLESLVLRRIEDASRREPEAAQALPQSHGVQQAQQRGPQPQQVQPRVEAAIAQQQPIQPPGSRPQPVLLQPHGLPPLGVSVQAQAQEAVPPLAPERTQQQAPSQVALVDGIQAAGPSPAAIERDSAFVF